MNRTYKVLAPLMQTISTAVGAVIGTAIGTVIGWCLLVIVIGGTDVAAVRHPTVGLSTFGLLGIAVASAALIAVAAWIGARRPGPDLGQQREDHTDA